MNNLINIYYFMFTPITIAKMFQAFPRLLSTLSFRTQTVTHISAGLSFLSYFFFILTA